MSDHIVGVECNSGQNTNCAIKLGNIYCDGYVLDKKIGVFSHFHEDHIHTISQCVGSYDVLITHITTLNAISALKPGIQYREQWTAQHFGTKYHTDGGERVRLLKANHIPGSAQVHVETDEATLLYSGDFNFPDVQIEHADYLVIDATHGDPWYDGKTDRRSVTNRLFEDVCEHTNLNKPVIIQAHTGTIQQIIHNFEIKQRSRMPDDVTFVIDEKQKKVLQEIYRDEGNGFRNMVEYPSKEFWSLVRNRKKIVLFFTGKIVDDELRQFYSIIIDKYRFKNNEPAIIPFDGGCRYNLAAHASIEGIYSYIDAVDPKYVVTDYSRSKQAPLLAKLINQKFPHIKAHSRPLKKCMP